MTLKSLRDWYLESYCGKVALSDRKQIKSNTGETQLYREVIVLQGLHARPPCACRRPKGKQTPHMM